jgi:protein-disulfide isomerase
MRVSPVIVGLLVGAVIGGFSVCQAQETKGQGGSKDVVAVVDHVAITQTDLEQKQSAKLLKARGQYFVAERDALNQLIDDTLLETQARKEDVGVDQLLDLHVTSQVKDPSEDQLRVYYEGLQTDTPYSEARLKILETIHTLRINKARAEYLQSLRVAADVQFMLMPPTADVALGDAPTRGPRDATVTIIEFADYECPYCQKIHPELKQLEEEFRGRVLFAFKDYPLAMHKRAEKAAEAARCAGGQGKFWEYHDALFEGKNGLEVSQLKEDARTVGLDGSAFDKCLDSGDQAAAIKQDLEEGSRLGLSGTPTLFVNKHVFSGATSYAILREAVEEQIALAPAAPKAAAGTAATHAKNIEMQTAQFPSIIREPRGRAASAGGGSVATPAAQ